MQQIYKTTSMLKCDFNKVALQLCLNHTQYGYSPVNLLHIFRTPFAKNISGGLLLKVITTPFCFANFEEKPLISVIQSHQCSCFPMNSARFDYNAEHQGTAASDSFPTDFFYCFLVKFPTFFGSISCSFWRLFLPEIFPMN